MVHDQLMPRCTGPVTNYLALGSREISGDLTRGNLKFPAKSQGSGGGEFELTDALCRSTEAYNIHRDLLNSSYHTKTESNTYSSSLLFFLPATASSGSSIFSLTTSVLHATYAIPAIIPMTNAA